MAKVKLSYSTSYEVAHLFANNSGLDAYSTFRASIRNFETHANYYSYNTVIAKHDKVKNVFLLSTCKYSDTTSKHQNELRSAIWEEKIYVPNVNSSHLENIKDLFDEAIHFAKKHTRARVNSYIPEASDAIDNAVKLIDYADLDRRNSLVKAVIRANSVINSEDEFIAELLQADEKDAERIKRATAKKKREQKRKLDEARDLYEANLPLVKQWRAIEKAGFRARKNQYQIIKEHEDLFKEYTDLERKLYGYFTLKEYKVWLRVSEDGNQIETSQRATIPTIVAKGLWRRIQRGDSVDGMSLGHYTVKSLEDDVLVVGCHTIDYEELLYIATELNLPIQEVA